MKVDFVIFLAAKSLQLFKSMFRKKLISLTEINLQERVLFRAFQTQYVFSTHELMNAIATGQKKNRRN